MPFRVPNVLAIRWCWKHPKVRYACNFFQPWEGLNCWAWMVLKTRLNNCRWTDLNLNWWVAAGFLNHQYWWMEPWNFMKLPGGGGKGIRMSKNKEELEQNFVQVQHLGEKANSSCQISLPASFLIPIWGGIKQLQIQKSMIIYGNLRGKNPMSRWWKYAFFKVVLKL